MIAVFLLDIRDAFGQRIGAQQVRRGDAVQDQVHQPDDIGERCLLLAIEGAAFQRLQLGRGFDLRAQVVIGFAQEPR